MSKRYYARRSSRRKASTRFYVIIGGLVIMLAVGIFFIAKALVEQPGTGKTPGESVMMTPPGVSSIPTDTSTPTKESTPTPKPTLSADLIPVAVTGKTDPATFGFDTDIMVGDETVESYTRPEAVSFGPGDEFTNIEGVITFRGNNYRDLASWGTAEITDEKLTVVNTKQNGAIGTWSGFAWTGQPLVIKWPKELCAKMTSLYDQFKNKEGFTEIIVATLDGNIYFEELETGEKTRDPIKVGAPIKGSPSIDPRGYPILYVGQGVGPTGGDTDDHMYIRAFNLIDGSLLYKWGYDSSDPFAYRQRWQAYDSSPLVSAEADTLIQPGENGVLYTVKLNTSYNPATGAVSINPEPIVKYRYTSEMNKSRDTKKGGRWGTEDSIVAWRNYVIFTDNAGVLQCVDLNTMTPVYVNDLRNDSDVSMVLEEDPANNTFYLYTACEYDDEVANVQPGRGTCYAYKINGITGEIIYEVPFSVDSTNTKVDGGILASPVLGREGTSMEGLIIYNITTEVKDGSTTSRLVALNKDTFQEVWSYDMDVTGWAPSSPVPVYTADGQGYIVQCDRNGDVALIRVGEQTCKEVYNLGLKETDSEGTVQAQNNFEATPVVYDNMIVVGSRSKNLFFIRIS